MRSKPIKESQPPCKESARWLTLQRLWNPERWLNLWVIMAIPLISLSFHHATTHSVIVKDFFAEWFAWPCAVISLALILPSLGRRDKTLKWCGLLLVGYLLYGTTRLLFSEYLYHGWEMWRTYCLPVAFLPAVFVLLQKKRSTHRLCWVAGATVALVSLYAVMQFVDVALARYWGSTLPVDPVKWSWNQAPLLGGLLRFLETDLNLFRWQDFPGPIPAVCSTIGNPNFLAGYLIAFLPLMLAWQMLRGWHWRRCLPLVGFVLCCLAMLFSTSRAGFLGATAAMGLFLMLIGGKPAGIILFPWLRKTTRVCGVILLLLVLVLFAVFVLSSTCPDVQKYLGMMESRAIVYRNTFALIGDTPWLGVGPGHFVVRFPDYMTGDDAEKFGWMESLEYKVVEHAESEWLEVLADLGVVGFGLYLGFLVLVVGYVRKTYQQITDRCYRLVTIALLAGLFGVICNACFSVNLRWTVVGMVYWGMLGALLGWNARYRATALQSGSDRTGQASSDCGSSTDHYRSPKVERFLRLGLVPVTLAISLVIFLPATRRFAGDWYFVRGRLAFQQGQSAVEPALLRSIKLNPYFAQPYYVLASYYFQQGEYAQAIRFFNGVQRLRGNVVVLAENIATAYFKLSQELPKDYQRKQALMKAITIYEQNLQRHPGYARLEDYLGRAYLQIGLVRQARECRLRAIELYDSWLRWGRSFPRPQYALDLAKNLFLEKEYDRAYSALFRAYTWQADSRKIETVLKSLVEVNPNYATRWQRQTSERELRKIRQRTSR